MKIILLSTARGWRSSRVDTARRELDAQPEDTLSLVGWLPAVQKLPVERHIVLGPTALSTPREMPVAAPGSTLDSGGPPVLDPDRAQTTAPDGGPQPEPEPKPKPGATGQRATSAVSRAVRRVRNSTKVRKLVSRVWPGVRSQYAVSVMTAPRVHALVSAADLVVAMDGGAHLAAWSLARRHPRPAVVVGFAEARRVLTDLRVQRHSGGSS